MNTAVMFSSATDLWSTPQWLFDQLNQEFKFEVDVCADSTNNKCNIYFSKEEDGLKQVWHQFKACWMNPPYGREIGKWVEKAYKSSRGGVLQ